LAVEDGLDWQRAVGLHGRLPMLDFEVAFAGNGKVINFSGKVLGATDVPVKDIVQLQHRDESRLARATFIPSQTWNGVDCLRLAERRTAVKNHSSQIQLSQGASVAAAHMGASPDTVLLYTTGLRKGLPTVLTVNNVTDLASPANTILSNSTVTLDEKLNTWLRLDETGGSTAFDSSGHDRHAMLANGVVPAYPGKVLGACSFDGIDDHVRLQAGYGDFTLGMTVSLWARTTAVDSWARFIDLGNGPGTDNILFARNGSTDRATFEVYRAGASGGKITTSPGSLRLSQWQHFAATLDAAGFAVIYLDGSPVTDGMTAVPEAITRTENFLGRSNWSFDDYFTGVLDDVRIYNRALSPAAIKALSREGNPLAAPRLVLTVSNGVFVIDYEGWLLGTDSLQQPSWQLVPDAFSPPYSGSLTTAQRFFRALSP
jgi:hypothetical protein